PSLFLGRTRRSLGVRSTGRGTLTDGSRYFSPQWARIQPADSYCCRLYQTRPDLPFDVRFFPARCWSLPPIFIDLGVSPRLSRSREVTSKQQQCLDGG